MMCETMANIPVEEKSSYVLTEDMIDAAMNEQFAYQEDLESEGETSSLEDCVDQDSQESSTVENTVANENNVPSTSPVINVTENTIVNTSPVESISTSNSLISNNNKVSVLVIETGLNKIGSEIIKSVKEIEGKKDQQDLDTSDSCLNNPTDVHNTSDRSLKNSMANGPNENKDELAILDSILSDVDKDCVIDLCESEADDYSEEGEEEDMNGAETIDDELSSVMETNLMAEIGLTVNKKTTVEPQASNHNLEPKAPESVAPRISVKNISQISDLPQNGSVNSVSNTYQSKTLENKSMKNMSFAMRNPVCNPNILFNGNNESSSSPIHINKIAIPHTRFINSQGQRMKCVYVKSTSALPTMPYFINTPTQTVANAASNTNMKYVVSQPVKKSRPSQMPAIAALKNLTKSVQPQSLVLPKNTRVLTTAQKLQKTSGQSFRNQSDGPNVDAIKKSLIFGVKKSYTPPDTFPENPIYTCVDCNNRFLLKTSLTHHIERRSMSIHFWCVKCKSELQFYNICTLSVHLRSHNILLNNINFAYISINPITHTMAEKGIVTTFLKDSESKDLVDQSKSNIVNVSNKLVQPSTTTSSLIDLRWKPLSVAPTNLTTQKITTLAGQSKGVCFQNLNYSEASGPVTSAVTNLQPLGNHLPLLLPTAPNPVKANFSSSEASGPVTSAVTNPQPLGKHLPLLLPKAPNPVKALSLIRSNPLQNQVKPLSAIPNKSPPPKSLILLCNKQPTSPNVQLNSAVDPIPPNVVCEADFIASKSSTSTVIVSNDTEMVIDDDVAVVPKNTEEEIVDVENVDGNMPSSSTPLASELEKQLLTGVKSTSSPSPKNKRNCSECKMYCPNISKHLNGSGRPLRLDLCCKICNLILPSKCALKIHHRIHSKISPFKCPDCGKDFTKWDELHAHLKFSCGHFAKCVRYICKGCKAHFPTQGGLTQHIVKNHSRDIFKCSLCPVAFYKKPSLVKHIVNDHPDEPNKKNLGMNYKQCEMCPKKLLPEESFLVHAKEHTNSLIYGYKCSMCNIVYANKMAFIIHQIKEKTKRDLLEKSGDRVFKENPSEEKTQASDSDSDFEDEPEIVRKYPDYENDLPMPEKDPLSLDDWECAQEQKVKVKTMELCIVCKKNSVVLLPGIDLNRQSLCCKQCVKPLDNTTESNKGSRKSSNSQSKTRNRTNKPKSVYRSSSTDEVKKVAKKRRSSDTSQNSSLENDLVDPLASSPPRKKNRKKQKDKFNSTGQTHIQGQVIKSRSVDELTHYCSKCDFVTEERESFLEHITLHRTDPNTYQCLECGLCFVVLPSLERHLQMHHGIKDASIYIENNRASLPQKPIHVEEETQDNQCRVCYEVFDCKSSLDKHFRIHGMAFMSGLSKSP